MRPDTDDDDDIISLGDGDYPEAKDLGPDERDRDLMDGTWEAEYYSGRRRTRDWNAIGAAIAIVVLAALVVPMLLVFFD